MEIGKKIKNLRIHNGLTQEELANRAELSKGYISQLENDVTSPSIATLVDILQCLGSDLKSFFNDMDDRQIVFKKSDVFTTSDDQEGHIIDWIIPNAQKNAMEPIRLTLHPGGKSPTYEPYPGETFGYILKGNVTLSYGSDSYKAKKGDAFYFEAKEPYHITNTSKSEAIMIWISTPPCF